MLWSHQSRLSSRRLFRSSNLQTCHAASRVPWGTWLPNCLRGRERHLHGHTFTVRIWCTHDAPRGRAAPLRLTCTAVGFTYTSLPTGSASACSTYMNWKLSCHRHPSHLPALSTTRRRVLPGSQDSFRRQPPARIVYHRAGTAVYAPPLTCREGEHTCYSLAGSAANGRHVRW
jgi:hypothetical protein